MIELGNKIISVILFVILITSIISCKIETKEDISILLGKNEFKNERVFNLNVTEKFEVFTLHVNYGEVKLEKGEEFNLKIKIYEEIENDVDVYLEEGKLIGKSRGNNDFAIGQVIGTVPEISSIHVENDSGDIIISGFDNKFILVNSGAGNVILSDCICEKELDTDTSAGNISITNAIAKIININTGAGNISLTEIEADEINCNSGLGNISVFESKANLANFDTGIGNISTIDCDFKDKKFSSGLGKIRDSESINRD